MNITLRFTIAAFLFLVSITAQAGTGSGKVTGYIPYTSGSGEVIIINTSVNDAQIACNSTTRYAKSEADPRFKATGSALLAAFMAGTPIKVKGKGKGTCAVWDNAEDIDYVCLGTIAC